MTPRANPADDLQTTWRDSANCATTDPELFFPEVGQSKGNAVCRSICSACDVQTECLADITEYESGLDIQRDIVGFTGGLSAQERKTRRREMAA